jgi:hypothetical protein
MVGPQVVKQRDSLLALNGGLDGLVAHVEAVSGENVNDSPIFGLVDLAISPVIQIKCLFDLLAVAVEVFHGQIEAEPKSNCYNWRYLLFLRHRRLLILQVVVEVAFHAEFSQAALLVANRLAWFPLSAKRAELRCEDWSLELDKVPLK